MARIPHEWITVTTGWARTGSGVPLFPTETFSVDLELQAKKVIHNDPATIIIWSDGSKTVVKCRPGEKYEPYWGFCAAVCKKIFGSGKAVKRAARLPKEEID